MTFPPIPPQAVLPFHRKRGEIDFFYRIVKHAQTFKDWDLVEKEAGLNALCLRFVFEYKTISVLTVTVTR